MAWSNGTFSRVHDWTADEASEIDIEAARMDQEDDSFATGINTCLTKDGQNTPTANLPMGGNRHTGVGNGAARTDYVAVNQIQDGDLYVAGSVAGANVIAGTMTPAITAYTNGMRVLFLPANANTGAATLNLNSVGAQSITKNGTTALAAGDLVDGVWADVVYDNANTNWILQNPQATYAVRSNNLSDLGSSSTARTNLGLGTAAVQADTRYNHRSNNLSDVSNASTARTNLGLSIGSDVQSWDAQLDDIAALAVTNGNFIVGNGSAWVAESGSTARTSLGLGSLATASTINNSDWSGTDLAVGNGGTGSSTAGGAATNLGLGTGDSPQFAGINVGHASDTTITRDAAGQIAVEGDAVFTHDDGAFTSAKITFSTSAPSGGSNGDIWFQYS